MYIRITIIIIFATQSDLIRENRVALVDRNHCVLPVQSSSHSGYSTGSACCYSLIMLQNVVISQEKRHCTDPPPYTKIHNKTRDKHENIVDCTKCCLVEIRKCDWILPLEPRFAGKRARFSGSTHIQLFMLAML